jgi:GcrA cell cycle regulator
MFPLLPRGMGQGDSIGVHVSWNDEKIQRLKKLWSDGLTTGEIGKLIGVSKNAVVGKAHRLSLKGRPSPIKRQDVKAPAAKKVETRIFTLVDLSAQTCRWPIGDPKHEDFHFCGKGVSPGKPYCAEHCAAAYVGSSKAAPRNNTEGPPAPKAE